MHLGATGGDEDVAVSERRKTELIGFKADEIEKATIDLAARSAGVTVSVLVRSAALDAATRELAAAGALGPDR